MAFTKITASGIGSTETVTLDGLSVINDGSFGGNVSVGGTLTYEDVTNIDSVGLITARAGVVVGSGITLSKDGDIFATGVTTATSFVGDGSQLTGVASTENIRTNTNATFLQNVNVSGTTTAAGNINVSGANITLGDSGGASDDRIVFGADSDQSIYHDGSNGYIVNTTGSMYILPKSGENGIHLVPDGAVTLYHDNSAKLATASGGVTVTGAVTATSFSGSGANLTNLPGVTIGSLTSFGTSATKDITINSTGIYKIELLFKDVSCSGGTDWQFQLGDSGGVETSGYLVSAGYYSNASYAGNSFRTDGFRWKGVADGNFIMQGIMTFTNYDGNRWIGQGHLGTQTSSDGTQYHLIGSKELSGALTTIRLMAASDSSETFDGGYYKIITHSS